MEFKTLTDRDFARVSELEKERRNILAAIGALTVEIRELESRRAGLMDRAADAEVIQQHTFERMFKEYGIDINDGDFTIDQINGQIMKRVGGEFIPIPAVTNGV